VVARMAITTMMFIAVLSILSAMTSASQAGYRRCYRHVLAVAIAHYRYGMLILARAR